MRWCAIILSSTVLVAGCEPILDSNESAAASTQTTRGPVTLTLTADPATADAGEQVRIRVTVTTQERVTMMTPLLEEAETMGAFTVLHRGETTDIPLEDGRRSWTQEVIVDSFEPGIHPVPAVELTFADDRTKPATTGHITSDPLDITIESLHADVSSAELQDIRGWILLPRDAWWPYIVGVGVLVGIGLWLTGRGRGDRILTPPPTAAEVARVSLSDLRHAGLLQRDEVDTFYVRLSGIVRTYIEGRFGLLAPRKTTSEFLHDAGGDAHLKQDQQSQLAAFLQMADLVKFARHLPPVEHGHDALDQAVTFVDETEATADESLPTTALTEAPAC